MYVLHIEDSRKLLSTQFVKVDKASSPPTSSKSTKTRQTGMNRREFAEYFGIPYRTVQDWELGNRQMPEYLLR